MRFLFISFLIIIFFDVVAQESGNGIYNVLDYGAKSDTTQFSTSAIQDAIDICTRLGGGRVVIPSGNFKTGSIQLKSNVILEIQEGATVYGATSIANYSEKAKSVYGRSDWNSALFIAYKASNFGIVGPGKIDGQGGSKSFIGADASIRPMIIQFRGCTSVIVQNISLFNSACWVQYYSSCNGVILDKINVYSFANKNNDGIDIDSQNVKVTNCIINSGDDGICLKSQSNLPCSNVEVSKCIVSSNANGIKFGTGSNTGFKDVYIHDCTVKAPPISPFLNWKNITDITDPLTNISGLTLEIVDGGNMNGVRIDNITMSGIMNPLLLWLGDRARNNPDKKRMPGTMQNIEISNITALNSTTRMTSTITGNNYYNSTLKQQVYQQIKNLTLKNISFISPGNSNKLDTTLVTLEPRTSYPEIYNISPPYPGKPNTKYNVMPSYGLFIRHVDGVTIENANFDYVANDFRPVFYLKDVKNLNGAGINYKEPISNGTFIKASDTSNIHFKDIVAVNKAIPQISWVTPFDIIYGTSLSSAHLNATSSIQGTFVYTPLVGTVLIAGKFQILSATFTPTSTANYVKATKQVAININRAPQTITFTPLANKVITDAPFNLKASASSSLPIAYSTTSNTITLTNGLVSIVGTGRATVTASQPGSPNYNAADPVSQSFCINPAKPSIAISNLNTPSPLLTSSATEGNQWYLDGVAIAGATSATYTATKSGSYQVQVTVDGCTGEFSVEQPLVITRIETAPPVVEVYPNPIAEGVLSISFGGIGGKKQVTVFALTGESLLSSNTESDFVAMDVANLTAGMYLARIVADGVVQTKKFKKQ